MKYLTVVLMALLIPTAAMAKGECKEDRQKFCKDAAHVGACLDQHKAQLSEGSQSQTGGKGQCGKRILRSQPRWIRKKELTRSLELNHSLSRTARTQA